MLIDLLPHQPPLPRLLEVHEVAYQLKCSQETVRRFIRDGKLKAKRLGWRWRIKPADLEAFIDGLEGHIARAEAALDDALSLRGRDGLREVRRPLERPA